MGSASVGVSNVAGQRLSAAGKAERNVTRKRFATGERFDFAWLERFAFASGERFLIADRIRSNRSVWPGRLYSRVDVGTTQRIIYLPARDTEQAVDIRNGDRRGFATLGFSRRCGRSGPVSMFHPVLKPCYSFPFAAAVTLMTGCSTKMCSEKLRKMSGERTFRPAIYAGSPDRRMLR